MNKQNGQMTGHDFESLDQLATRPTQDSAPLDKKFFEGHRKVAKLLLENHRSQLQKLDGAMGQVERLAPEGMRSTLKIYEKIRAMTEGRIRTLEAAEMEFAEAEARWCSPQN
jgi:hypothetical protein